MRYVLEHYSRDDFDGDLTNKQYDLTNNLTINRIVDESPILHCFFAELCTRKFQNRQKNKVMKRRIIYVGTLIDLAAIFEPDEEAESIEVTNIIKYERNE